MERLSLPSIHASMSRNKVVAEIRSSHEGDEFESFDEGDGEESFEDEDSSLLSSQRAMNSSRSSSDTTSPFELFSNEVVAALR